MTAADRQLQLIAHTAARLMAEDGIADFTAAKRKAVQMLGLTDKAKLPGNAEVEDVHAENLRAHRLGINGVPCFVVSGRHAIAGAQEPEVLERLLDIAITEGEFA